MDTYIALAGILIALFALIWQSYLTRQQMKLNFFADYTKRYQEIVLNLPVSINDKSFSFEDLEVAEKEIILRYMRVYFDLCSEEFYLFQSKKISKKVWKDWSSGIKLTMEKKAFRDAWELLNKNSRFYPDFERWIVSNMKPLKTTKQ